MKNMAYSMTTTQMKRREKDVTRRWAWYDAKPGDVVMAIEKGMGLKKGEKVARLYPIRFLSAQPEPLQCLLDDPEYGRQEMIREGFPARDPADFVAMLRASRPKDCPHEHPMRIVFEEVVEAEDMHAMDDDACWNCGGAGVFEGDCTCMDDTCCCLEPDPPACDICMGTGFINLKEKK